MKISELLVYLERALIELGDAEISLHADGAVSNLGYVKYYGGELHLFDKMYDEESWVLCFEHIYGDEP